MNKMFIGREKELTELQNAIEQNRKSVLIYGRRKVGKTTLILKAFQLLANSHPEKTAVYYECTKDTESNNVDALLKECRKAGFIPPYFSLENKTFLSLFQSLDSLGKPLVIAIDEYPYLREFTDPRSLDSFFQKIIDNYCTNITLILSGSHIGVMKSLMEERNPLFGRFGLRIILNELTYREAALFFPGKTNYEKVAYYAVFGGSPYVLSALDPNMTVEENIIHSMLDYEDAPYLYASHILISEIGNRPQAERVLAFLKNGKKRYSEMEEALEPKKNGNLSKVLQPLLEMEIIKKTFPINRLNDAKKTYYEINDNLLRFYYTFLYPNKSTIAHYGPSLAYDELIREGLDQFVAHRFEEIAKQYIWMKIREQSISGVKGVGTYYYDDPIAKKNGEFDVAVLKANGVDLFETKYWKGKVDQMTVDEELRQIRQIKELPILKIGFISINGYVEGIKGLDYLIDGEDLFQ